MRNADCGMRTGKKELKNFEFHIPNSEFDSARWARLQIAECRMRNADCKRKPKKSAMRNPQSEITRPMLFSRNALASEPQAYFLAKKEIAKMKGGKDHFFLLTCLEIRQ